MGAEPGPAAASSAVESLIALDGVHCANCVQRLEGVLADRVERCEVDLATRTASIRHDPARLTLRALMALLEGHGFRPRRLRAQADDEADPERSARERRSALARIGVGVLGAMQVMMLAWPGYFSAVPDAGVDALLRWAQLLIATPTVFWAGAPFFAGAAQALRARALTMDVPVALSLAIAWAASAVRTAQGEGALYFDAATMFVALLLIGRHLEAATRARAVARLRQLAGSVPAVAQRLVGAQAETVALDALRVGDRLRVLPGEAVPVDGVLEAAAELDEALITGESRPVARAAGELAMAGALNLSRAPLVLRATALGEGTRIAGILRLLQRAALRKPPMQTLADRIAAHFTLGVLVLAALGGVLASRHGADAALNVIISVLVASCPCALSLSVPAVLAAGTARLAGRGVLVTRADRLLRLAEVDTVLLDKTGTLTEARLSLQRCVRADGIDEARARQLAAALESGLSHPIARALVGEGPFVSPAEDVRVDAGRGVSGRVDGRRYTLAAADAAVSAQDRALTWVTLSDAAGAALAHFGLGAPLRAEAPGVVGALSGAGLGVALLTGDGAEAAGSVARRCGIPTVAARQTPEDKLAHLRRLQEQGHVVLTVGDGLNDAPFLAAADVSAAMPSGAAITQARADLLLVNDHLDGLLLARDVGRQARRRVRENLGWALAYNLAVLPLAFLGLLEPWIAAAGMSLSSLWVVGNALRLRLPERV